MSIQAEASRPAMPSAPNGLNGRTLGSALQAFGQTLIVPILSILTALIAGAILILLAGRDPVAAYQALIDGALLEPRGLIQSLLKTSPLILSGLAVGFAFKGGLFNIGAQGQLIMGSVAAAWIGATDLGVPIWLHITLAFGAGALIGAIWGGIPGALKAYYGANEVITTIMFNFIASRVAEWLISNGSTDGRIRPGPLTDPNSGAVQRSRPVLENARLPVVFDYPPPADPLNVGIFIAVAAAIIVLIIVNRTTFGFELRMVGQNPNAARYAGVNVPRQTMLTMAIAGALAGMAGVIQTLGVNGYYEANQSLGLGFDSITVSLLAANHPIGIIFSAFLFGALEQGSTRMQRTGVAPELVVLVQALILMFIAAPQIIQYIYRVRVGSTGGQRLSSSWGQK
ncbi:MAG: ABC transporter permease [Phototrophicales bacterium]|nr:MAG: ABC transporter permease [Phototrophicales bacterium]